MFLFHGIAAYRGTRAPLQQVRAAEGCLSVEICGATRPIGPIGIMVDGDVTAAFDQDVWSWVDADGRRHPAENGRGWYRSAADDGVDLGDSADLERWLKNNAAPDYHGDYCEAFVVPRRITHVWVKKYVGKKTRMVARIIARRHGAVVIEVETYTRPWDVVGHFYDADYERACDLAEQYGVEIA